MLKYLVVQLDDTSIPYCHYENSCDTRRLIGYSDLKAGILFAMKENLSVQFVYPEYELPEEYKSLINSIDHTDITPAKCSDIKLLRKSEVVVFNAIDDMMAFEVNPETICVLRLTKTSFYSEYKSIMSMLDRVKGLNVLFTDIIDFSHIDEIEYAKVLSEMVSKIAEIYSRGRFSQLNLLTDRLILDKMNNCNAGWESIALAPDGKFYVCPAFYSDFSPTGYTILEAKFSIGDPIVGITIKNPQLYRLSHAPLCRKCDAFQCRRCVWWNLRSTYEVNTPSHEQCVMAHIERNASRELMRKIRESGLLLSGNEIKEIDYLDPLLA